jgi:hypothetical protein
MRDDTRALLSGLNPKVLDALEYNIESVMLERQGEPQIFKKIPWPRVKKRNWKTRLKHRNEMRKARANRALEDHADILEKRRQAYKDKRASMTGKELFQQRVYHAQVQLRFNQKMRACMTDEERDKINAERRELYRKRKEMK